MDPSSSTSASFKAAARGKIVDYADAHPELRRQMEDAMEKIDRNPDSWEAIYAYGRTAQERLDAVLNEMQQISARNPLNPQALRQTMTDAEQLGLCRLDTTRELSMLLGATKEVLRRYNEEYIPQAHKDFSMGNDPEDELYLQDVMRRKEDFMTRTTELERSRVVCVNAGISLRNRMEEWEATRSSGTLETKIVIFSRPLQLKTSR
jgi:hypothetical protein